MSYTLRQAAKGERQSGEAHIAAAAYSGFSASPFPRRVGFGLWTGLPTQSPFWL
jgi:hypothetical protein